MTMPCQLAYALLLVLGIAACATKNARRLPSGPADNRAAMRESAPSAEAEATSARFPLEEGHAREEEMRRLQRERRERLDLVEKRDTKQRAAPPPPAP